jgi:exonuclease III
MQITKLASIDINAIAAPTRSRMLIDFVKLHDFDLVMLQEVTEPDLLNSPRYTVH